MKALLSYFYIIFNLFFLKFREVYHTKRMQHVICVKWSSDSKYILSGSDEMNIRLWKANAAEKLGVVSPASSSISLLLHLYFFPADFIFKAACCCCFFCVPINSCIFCSCQTYCTLYLPPVFYLILFYELAAFFDTAMALGPPQQGKSG